MCALVCMPPRDPRQAAHQQRALDLDEGQHCRSYENILLHFVTLSCKMSLLKSVPVTLITFQHWDFTFSWLIRELHLDELEPLQYLFRNSSGEKKKASSFNQKKRLQQ